MKINTSRWLVYGITIVLLLLVVIGPSFATDYGDDVDVDVDVGTDVVSELNNSVNVSTGSTTMNNETPINVEGDQYDSWAVALGMPSFGDVAIANCVVSKQTAYPFYSRQRFDYDWFCVAGKLDLRGQHAAAATVRCEMVKELRKLHGDDCERIWTFTPPIEEPVIVEEDNDHEEWLEEQQELIVDLQAKIANLEKEKSKPAPVTSRTIVERKPFLSEKQRAALEEVLNDD